jgi:hypothetical protein
MAVHGTDSGLPACGLDPMMGKIRWYDGIAIRERDGLRKARNRIMRYFPKKGMGPWWNWYINRKRVPLPYRNERLAEQYMRRNSWRKVI